MATLSSSDASRAKRTSRQTELNDPESKAPSSVSLKDLCNGPNTFMGVPYATDIAGAHAAAWSFNQPTAK